MHLQTCMSGLSIRLKVLGQRFSDFNKNNIPHREPALVLPSLYIHVWCSFIVTNNPLKSLCEAAWRGEGWLEWNHTALNTPHAQWSISRHSRELLAIIWGFQLAVRCEVSDRQRGQLKLQGTNITAHYFTEHRRRQLQQTPEKARVSRKESQLIKV